MIPHMDVHERTPDRYELDDPREWLRVARQDYAFAVASIPAVRDFELHCYHAQQAAEKALKAVCIARGLVFPFTHEIARLLRVLAVDGLTIPPQVRAAAGLTRFATSSRYPPRGVVGTDAFAKAVATAREVVDWAAAQVAESRGVREQPARRYRPARPGPRDPDPQVLEEAVARIVAITAPERIILFGSGARGTMGPHSDVDLMIVIPREDVDGELDTAMRTSLAEIETPIDIVLVTSAELERYGGAIGLVYRPALEEGRVLYVGKPE